MGRPNADRIAAGNILAPQLLRAREGTRNRMYAVCTPQTDSCFAMTTLRAVHVPRLISRCPLHHCLHRDGALACIKRYEAQFQRYARSSHVIRAYFRRSYEQLRG